MIIAMSEVVAFHVDRSAALVAGAVLELALSPSMPAGGPDLAHDWGLMSRHGAQYAMSGAFDGSTVSEWIFELVRRAEFPDCPSRFQSIFALGTLADARAFRHAIGGNHLAPIVRVRGEEAHRGNMSLIRWTAPAATTLARAREYWRSEEGLAPPLWEVLLHPPVSVIDLVDETEPS